MCLGEVSFDDAFLRMVTAESATKAEGVGGSDLGSCHAHKGIAGEPGRGLSDSRGKCGWSRGGGSIGICGGVGSGCVKVQYLKVRLALKV